MLPGANASMRWGSWEGGIGITAGMGKTPLEEPSSLWKSFRAKSTEGICRLFAVGHVMPIPGFPAARFAR